MPLPRCSRSSIARISSLPPSARRRALVDRGVVARRGSPAVLEQRRRLVDQRGGEPRRERGRARDRRRPPAPRAPDDAPDAGRADRAARAARSASWPERTSAISSGRPASASRSRPRSRGVATPSVALPASRSRSAIRDSARRIASHSAGRSTSQATASWRRRICATSTQRVQEPAPQQPAAGRGGGLVDDVEQRALLALADQGLGELEVGDRGLVEHDGIARPVELEPHDRQRAGRLGGARVADRGGGGADRERAGAGIVVAGVSPCGLARVDRGAVRRQIAPSSRRAAASSGSRRRSTARGSARGAARSARATRSRRRRAGRRRPAPRAAPTRTSSSSTAVIGSSVAHSSPVVASRYARPTSSPGPVVPHRPSHRPSHGRRRAPGRPPGRAGRGPGTTAAT